MQQAQGFDLLPYAGEKCTQYRYRITNYPNTPDGVFATLIVFEGNITAACARPAQRMASCTALRQTAPAMRCRSRSSKMSASPAPNTGESTQNPTESETT